MLIPWTPGIENEEGQDNGYNTQPNDLDNTRRTHFHTNDREHRITRIGNEDSRFMICNGTNTKNYSSKVDDVQLSNGSEEKHGDSSRLINSINSFTTELKEKLQKFSLSKGEKIRCDDGTKFGEPDSSHVQHFHCQTSCSSNDVVIPVKLSYVASLKSSRGQKLDTKKHEKSYPSNDFNLKHNVGLRINDSNIFEGNGESTSLHGDRFKRFYHVFIKEELSELVQSVPGLKVLTQNYDHGNWVVMAEKH